MKTAVEWLVEEIKTLIDNGYVFNPKWEQPMIEEAKKMEKQQIKDAYEVAYMDGYIDNGKDGKQYYNETFKK